MRTCLSLSLSLCLSLSSLLLLAACSAPPWQPDPPLGAVARSVLTSQVLAPDAGRQASAVNGIDGHAAAASQQRYQRSFSEPAPAPAALTIGVSGVK
jgi:hypothetical protein